MLARVARTALHSVFFLRFALVRHSAFASAIVAFVVASCTLGDAPPNCVPGRQTECAGPHGCPGHQQCDDQGNRFLECTCDPGGTVPPFTIDAGPDGTPPNMLGAPCITDKDCGPRLFCLASGSKTIFDEGPSNGLCVADCAKDATVCADLDPTSICRTFDDAGTPTSPSDDIAYCTRGCTTGAPSGFQKCFGRPDVACIALGPGTTKGTCIPACRNDADCSPRYCDLGSGFCADGPRKGSAIGEACSASTKDTCSGFCNVTGSYGVCSGFCSNGSVGCGETSGPPFDQFCVFPQSTDGAWNGGDFGYCGKLCDCDDDCGRADSVCSPLPEAQATGTGRKGVCRSALIGNDPRPGIPCAP